MALDQATLAATRERIAEIQRTAPSESAARAQIAREAQEAFGEGAASALAQATGMREADVTEAARQVGYVLPTTGRDTGGAERRASRSAPSRSAPTRDDEIRSQINAVTDPSIENYVRVARSQGYTGEDVARALGRPELAEEYQGYIDRQVRDDEIRSQIYAVERPSIPNYVRVAKSQGYTGEEVARALGRPELAEEYQGYLDELGDELGPYDLNELFPGLDLSGLTLTGNVEEDLEALRAEYIKQAAELAGRDFVEYEGERVVGFTPAEQAARQRMLDLSLAGVGFPQVEQALATASQVAGYTPSLLRDVDLTPYQSQYQQGVTDIALRELDRQRQMRQQDIAQQAIQAGAFGGSRQGVVESELERTYAQQAGDIATRGAQAGLEYAQRGALADLAAQQAAPGIQLQGASALSQGANQLRSMGYTDAEVAQALGQSERALGQAGADVAYQTFLEAQGFPAQQLAYLTAPLGGSSVIQQAPAIDQPNTFESALGTAGLLGSTYNLLTGGTVFGGQGSLFGGPGSFFGNPFDYFRS